MKIIFSQQIIEKHFNIKIIKIWLLGGEMFHAGGQMDTDRYKEVHSRFSQFYEHAQKLNHDNFHSHSTQFIH